MSKMFLFGLLICLCSLLQAQQELEGTLEHDNITRNYIIYIPSSYSVGDHIPLVFNFHGFTSNAVDQRFYSDMNVIAEAEGFMVCYPNGVGNAWNVDWTFGSTADDLGFTGALIDELSNNYSIDLARVYSCGMSNGGFFSYQLACEMSDRIAAVASVTGSFSPNMSMTCSPSRKVPIMEIHGTNDNTVAYDGSLGISIAIEDVIDFWVDHNNCPSDPVEDTYSDIDATDNSTVTRFRYMECEDASEVYFLKVNDGGHSWPGAAIAIPGINTNMDISASQEIWDFFERHQIEELSATNPVSTDEQFLVFPNPVKGKLNLSTTQHILASTIYNTSGKIVSRHSSNNRQIDLSQLPSGIYFLKVNSTHQTWIRKIVKN